MFSRHVYMSMLLGAAAGIPYLTSSEFRSGSSSTAHEASGGGSDGEHAPGYDDASGSGVAESPGGDHDFQGFSGTGQESAMPPSPSLQAIPTIDLNTVMNFTVTPAWVLQQWPRVSASLAELDFHGYRVPLVTGTREDDLAGSLTYYFDRDQRVARITFYGSTGDPRKLITLVTGRYGFVQDATDDPAVVVFDVKWNKKPYSILRLRPVKIVRANDPRARYDVELSIQRY